MANLINAGIVPLTFANESDYDKIDQMDELKIENIGKQIANGKVIKVTNVTKGFDFEVNADLSDRQKKCFTQADFLTIQNKIHNVIQNAMLLGVAFLCYKV